MANRKSFYNKIKKHIQKDKDPEDNNLDPSLLEGDDKIEEEQEVPQDFIDMFSDYTKEDIIRELYTLSMEYREIKRDNELMNFRLTKIEMQKDN